MTLLLEPSQKPRRRRHKPAPGGTAWLGRLLQLAIAATFAVPVDALRARSRGRADIAFARQCAIYLAHVALGLNYSAAGRLFARDRTTAAHACRLVEARRDNPAVDRRLSMLEEICADLPRPPRRLAEPGA